MHGKQDKVHKTLIANWKMHGDPTMLAQWLMGMGQRRGQWQHADLLCVLAAPYLWLPTLHTQMATHDLPIALTGQDCHGISSGPSGAYTGDISAAMLAMVGCGYCIVGHSERRRYYAEADAEVAQKAQILQAEGVTPIVCVGESEAQYHAAQTEAVLNSQCQALEVIFKNGKPVVLAYEPIWAIGTGRTPTAQEIGNTMRWLRSRYSMENVTLVYGGSVSPENAEMIAAIEAVEGVLIGGASLDAGKFAAIAAAFARNR